MEVESSLSTSTTQLAKESKEVEIEKDQKETKLEATLSLDPATGYATGVDFGFSKNLQPSFFEFPKKIEKIRNFEIPNFPHNSTEPC